ncbi:MAG: hypothetical protein ACI8X5_004211 [Planctomycetota bacterium]|jgi:hypothetical protein
MNEGDPEMHDEDLVAWLLDPAAHAEPMRAQSEQNEDVTERLAGYSEFLESCRSELHVAEELGTENIDALTKAILRRTTREKKSWAVAIQNRLGSSVILRVLAASLLLHVAVLPVLAYYTLVEPESGTHIGFEFPSAKADSPFEDSIPEPDVESAPVLVNDERALDSLASGSGASSRGQNAWGRSLDLVLHCKLLMDLASSTNESWEFQEQLNLSLLRLRTELLGLDEVGKESAVARLLANEWLRAEELDLVAGDALLNAHCGTILGLSPSREPVRLKEAAWRLTFERAQRED